MSFDVKKTLTSLSNVGGEGCLPSRGVVRGALIEVDRGAPMPTHDFETGTIEVRCFFGDEWPLVHPSKKDAIAENDLRKKHDRRAQAQSRSQNDKRQQKTKT